MTKEPLALENPTSNLNNLSSKSFSEKNNPKTQKRISKISKLKGKENLENFIAKNSKNFKNSELLLTKQAFELKKSLIKYFQQEDEDSEQEENLSCRCLRCDKALALKRAKYFINNNVNLNNNNKNNSRKIAVWNFADFNNFSYNSKNNFISDFNFENENFDNENINYELTYKKQEDCDYDAFFADYLDVSYNAVNHFVEKFNIDNFNNHIRDSLIPTIDTLKVQKRRKLEEQRKQREFLKIKIKSEKSEESKSAFKDTQNRKFSEHSVVEGNNYNGESSSSLVDNYIFIDKNSSDRDVKKFDTDCVGKFSDSSLIKTYEIIGNLEEGEKN